MIYIIDADTKLAVSLKQQLNKSGYEAQTFELYEEILIKLDGAVLPDIIIAGTNMPQGNAFEFCIKVKEAAGSRFIPVILLIEKDNADELIKGLDAGADDFIPKPVRPLLVDAKVKAMLRIRDLHEKLQSRKDRFKSELDLQNKASATIVHDLRSPLSAIKMANEAMMDAGDDMDFDTRLMFMSTVDNEANRMLNLVNNLLDMFKLKSGEFTVDHEEFNLADVIIKTYSSLNAVAIDKQITIKLLIENSIMVNGDFSRLQQVIYNILNNAIKFTREQGGIRIASEVKPEKVRISISDNGVGIPEEDLPHIFQEFKQAASKSTKQEKGTGLGLAISRKIVEAHNGKLWVESKLGEGSTFHIELPGLEAGRNLAGPLHIE